MLAWIFDPVPPSGALQGGVPTAHALKADIDIDTFVREVLQNCYDQRVDPVAQVRFTFHQLDGDRKDQFLDGIGFNQLEQHILGSTETGLSLMGLRLIQGLEAMYDRPLRILRIDDSGTRGLLGGEDDRGKNFNALCRNVLDTAEDRPMRGGSFGLGKSVLWRFSSISTVLFSSRIVYEDPEAGFRLFGRTELPHHVTGDGRWSGPGWYGTPEQRQGQWRAISVWHEEAEQVAKQSYLFRPAQLGAGTTILVVGFFEPGEEETRALDQVASDVLRSATRWFWPSIKSPGQSLRVCVEAWENGSRVYSQTADIDNEVLPFVAAMTAPSIATRVSEPADVAEKTLKFRVPARQRLGPNPGSPEVDAELTLRLRRAGTENSVHMRNRVALVRGAGFVVEYRQPSRSPLDEQPYHAVLCAGLAHGNSQQDESLERFLRAAEPPSHNQWIPGTERIQTEYQRGARARLQQLWRDLDNAVVELCEEQVPATMQGPNRLAELFPLGGRGGGSAGRQKFRVEHLNAYQENGAWHFSGRVTRQVMDERPWTFNVSLWLDAETGRGEPMTIASLEVSDGSVRETGGEWDCDVAPSIQEVTFNGESKPGAESIDTVGLRRTCVRLEVRPHIDGGT